MENIIITSQDPTSYIKEPSKYKNNSGQDLFGYPLSQMSQAFLYYNYYLNSGEINKAILIFEHIKLGIEIEELCSMAKKYYIKIAKALDLTNNDIDDLTWHLYSLYLNKPITEIKQLVHNIQSSQQERWNLLVPDQDNITVDQLNAYYDGEEFPSEIINITSGLPLAYRTLPALIQKQFGFKRVFDFGGNIGISLSVLANNDPTSKYTLIELNTQAMHFAKWRNNLIGLTNIDYINSNTLNKDTLKGQFDFGICTEVLEHLYDVEAILEIISNLLEPGGVLFLTASFGYYPHPGHLKKNVKYAGHEDLLLSKFGFTPIKLNLPIPLLNSFHIYRKL
ncbi:MAG: hypothetical protein ATN31_01090 [Candidatus Epulonipiscioides saccharophilum]|nr:MAG: hypothetical protein ATN31_01090 [Epulopiscium sp. AS2M-Bin001]